MSNHLYVFKHVWKESLIHLSVFNIYLEHKIEKLHINLFVFLLQEKLNFINLQVSLRFSLFGFSIWVCHRRSQTEQTVLVDVPK